jgi:hypothetical protein
MISVSLRSLISEKQYIPAVNQEQVPASKRAVSRWNPWCLWNPEKDNVKIKANYCWNRDKTAANSRIHYLGRRGLMRAI